MADEVNARDGKLIQWLNEAYGKEKQLETALAAHIQMAEAGTYKKRLQQHLKETKSHARDVERRIKKLGGKAEAIDVPGPEVVTESLTAVANVAGRAVAQAQGAVQAVRGTSDWEKRLKNAKDELNEEAQEIANYTAIIALAEQVGDTDTAKVAKAILREEQRMYDYLAKQIPRLTKEVVKAEIPAKERKKASSSRSRSTSARRASSRTSANGSSSSGARSTARKAASSGRKAASSGRKAASTAGKTAKTAAKSGSTAAKKTAKTARSSSKTAAKRTATTARKSASGSSSKATSSRSRSSNSGSGSSSSRSSGSARKSSSRASSSRKKS